MFKLIRDKIPEIAKKEKQVINYATAENDELYIALLRNKFAEEASEFLNTGDVSELADVLTVLKAIVKAAGVSEEDFDKVYDTLEEVGYLRDEIIDTVMPQLFDRHEMIQ